MSSIPELGARRALFVVLALALGLWADLHTQLPGQLALGLVFWGLLFALLAPMPPEARRVFFACAAIATAGELFLSLGWGLYTYRLGGVPQFVPPGHALMLLLALNLSRRMPEAAARMVIGGAGIGALAAGLTGFDTLALPLFLVLALAALLVPAHVRLYASTFLLCLALELYGTALGNWSWAHDVPWIGHVTTNPPALVGAFYCALDALVLAFLASPVASRQRALAVTAA